MKNPFDSRPEAGLKRVDAKDARGKRENAKEGRTNAGEKGRTCKLALLIHFRNRPAPVRSRARDTIAGRAVGHLIVEQVAIPERIVETTSIAKRIQREGLAAIAAVFLLESSSGYSVVLPGLVRCALRGIGRYSTEGCRRKGCGYRPMSWNTSAGISVLTLSPNRLASSSVIG